MKNILKNILLFLQSVFFSATSHGKSACNGIRARVNRSTALESLRRPMTNQILNLKQILEHCQNTISKIHFQEIDQQVLEKTRNWFNKDFVVHVVII